MGGFLSEFYDMLNFAYMWNTSVCNLCLPRWGYQAVLHDCVTIYYG